uniref:Ig-like domain-containing protein n=1 Tax=Neolamprologus brichardi TaxID=32507 RepID=A0A3Q4I643_NEOBR
MLGTISTIIVALACVDAAKVLTQTPPVHTVSPGQEVLLKCNIQRPEGYYVSWYKQVPGSNHSSPDFGTGFSSDRFNSKASSNIDYQFIIKRAEAGDSAVYYCSTWDNSAQESVSQLFVCSYFSLPPPVLTVYLPCSAELQSNKASLVCLTIQTLDWVKCPLSSGISTSTAVPTPAQTFQISSVFVKTIKTPECHT